MDGEAAMSEFYSVLWWDPETGAQRYVGIFTHPVRDLAICHATHDHLMDAYFHGLLPEEREMHT